MSSHILSCQTYCKHKLRLEWEIFKQTEAERKKHYANKKGVLSKGMKITPASKTSKENAKVFAVSLFSQFLQTISRKLFENWSIRML